MVNYRKSLSKGFILIDVLVAIVVITVALVPISGLFIHAMQADALAKDYIVASNLAQKQLELLKTHSSEYWCNLSLPCTIPWQDTLHPLVAPYRLTTEGTNIANEALVQVTVNITWQKYAKEYKLQVVNYYPKL